MSTFESSISNLQKEAQKRKLFQSNDMIFKLTFFCNIMKFSFGILIITSPYPIFGNTGLEEPQKSSG
jgi:hypothetical protein